MIGIVKKTVNDEDYKSAIAQMKPDIPKNAEVEIECKFSNLYGEYYSVRHNGIHYNLKLSDVQIKECD